MTGAGVTGEGEGAAGASTLSSAAGSVSFLISACWLRMSVCSCFNAARFSCAAPLNLLNHLLLPAGNKT